jgi:hypothetical protein
MQVQLADVAVEVFPGLGAEDERRGAIVGEEDVPGRREVREVQRDRPALVADVLVHQEPQAVERPLDAARGGLARRGAEQHQGQGGDDP